MAVIEGKIRWVCEHVLGVLLKLNDEITGSVRFEEMEDVAGYRKALTLLLLSATLNHIRRVLLPGLGQWAWHAHPLEDLRLARSNPEVFVAEMLGASMRH
ncbi:hypothetical protein C8A05DRAFT_37913, partial [Staphylotrichum tortipilum]